MKPSYLTSVLKHKPLPVQQLVGAGLIAVMALGLSACGGGKDKKPGQALVSVNGEEITVLQLNEELQRAGVQAGQQEQASKQLLESLIDRQLLLNEAVKDKTDRDPKVVQAVERAKALIVAQAYLQKHIGPINKPSKEEVEAYFTSHPGFFAQRKQLDMRQLVLASRDVNDGLKAAMDASKSLDEVAAYLDAHQLKYARAQLSRMTSDLPPELSTKLQALPKGQLFIIREGERSLLIQIADIKDAPVTLATSAPQIEQFLMNKKAKEASEAEVKRLRATAKIDYLNKVEGGDKKAAGAASTPDAASAPAAPAASAPAPAPAPAAAAPTSSESTERGVAGLK